MSEAIIKALKEQGVEGAISKAWNIGNTMARLGTSDIDSVLKAMDTAEAGGGAEHIPTGFSPDLINQFRQELKVSSLFRHVPMPTNPYKLPVEGGPATPYHVAENTADTGQTSVTGSNVGTANVTFTAKSFGAATRISKELTQDSIVAWAPFIQSNILRGLAEGVESAIINGDTQTTHQDTDIESAGVTHADYALVGLRRHAIANSYTVDFNGDVSLENLRLLRREMGKYGINPDRLAYICSNSAYMQILDIPEVLTMDKYGANASVLTGEMAKIDGVPVVVSSKMRQDLNASGVNGASANTFTGILLVNRDSWLVGDRQTIELDQTDEPIVQRQRTILGDLRWDFQPAFAIASNPIVAFGYDITS